MKLRTIIERRKRGLQSLLLMTVVNWMELFFASKLVQNCCIRSSISKLHFAGHALYFSIFFYSSGTFFSFSLSIYMMYEGNFRRQCRSIITIFWLMPLLWLVCASFILMNIFQSIFSVVQDIIQQCCNILATIISSSVTKN